MYGMRPNFDGPTIELNFLNAKISKYIKLLPPNNNNSFGAIRNDRLKFWKVLPVSQNVTN